LNVSPSAYDSKDESLSTAAGRYTEIAQTLRRAGHAVGVDGHHHAEHQPTTFSGDAAGAVDAPRASPMMRAIRRPLSPSPNGLTISSSRRPQPRSRYDSSSMTASRSGRPPTSRAIPQST